ncbi:MAG: hypothetical protein K0S55_1670 [Clostridia bacterium]|nr:hypothetical protein [Clostridia bacterium]
MKHSTIWVLTFVFLIFGILTYFGIQASAPQLIIVGAALVLFGLLCTLPDLIHYFKGKHREWLIKKGKLIEPQKKAYNPKSRFDDND